MLDTRILCEIRSDLSSADEKKFIEKNRNFWSLKKHYLRIEYAVRVLIGPADIRFELWFDNQKLSRDQSIKVEWIPTKVPRMASTPTQSPQGPNSHLPELPDSRPLGGDPRAEIPNKKSGKFSMTSTSQEESPDRAERTKRSMGGLLRKARDGKWTVYQ